MEKSAHYFIVGLFVLISLAALAGFVIWLAGPHEKKDYAYYTIYFTDPVNGLEEGGTVTYKGMKAGKVLGMRLATGRNDLIKVDIGVNKQVPVRAGTQARLEIEGITGLVRLEMTTEPGDTRPVPYREGEPYPVLQGTGSRLESILQALPAVTGQITSAAGEARDTAHAVRGLAEKLQNNPSQILYPPPANGVEIPP